MRDSSPEAPVRAQQKTLLGSVARTGPHARRHNPPQHSSAEADADQLKVARTEGEAHGKALHAMAEEDGAATCRAGDYVIAFVNEKAEGHSLVLTVRIAVPTFMRHDPVNGKRYAQPVTARFEKVRFASERKPSPRTAARHRLTDRRH
ncbi:hypothetical protein AB0C12_12845 [Actinoplanes sp. NPDC048967]|uniref:hypothetical protein n=1 Tax=Actinoplanes sp. NPDC048967 TaxID=3155269 RepID=UPI0033C1F12A